ncbi:pyrroloquinoline quinone precursor peptide PqqA [Wenjunlia tyrosinilytica]|jgi:coenzyme PQQ precursor peptide PqqA|uniref:Coenzyme PQQ synthesis protein A n=1 Tax=Wenjunlia tyrosinilytica TaxID=1544741 RepID=A0A917ZC60_9ACTN|nr:pyrroloquinoline quinone precursor peptide PqqA [Wenjunlia tyrosinilytica]GGO80645.1 hypothetical protein GCM10012280_03050 [Wenjunlia tyrosinilytica]
MTAPHDTAGTPTAKAPKPEETAWVKPDYQVVDTSMECTAYVLTKR